MEKQVFDEKERLKTTLLSAGDGVISTDKYGNVELLNKNAEQLTGWTQEEASGRKFDEIFNIINEFTREKSENLVQIILESGKPFLIANHRILIEKKGTERPVEENAAPIKDVDGNINGVVLVFRDYTETKERQNRIEYLSYRDQLTGLYNRRFYEEELKRLNTERNLPISIIIGDVNGLKLVNDAFGHEKGDEFLLKAASAIQRACRTEDIVARWGGDEFVILLPKTKTEDAREIVKRIKQLSSIEHVNAVCVNIAFGWETKRTADEDIMQVLKNAEDYMYKHKIIENEGQKENRINAIIHTLYEKSPREEKHSQRVSKICQQIGKAIGFSEIEVCKIRDVGLFHDIGKIAIEEGILDRPGKLTEQEQDEIKRHPDIGYRILSSSHEMVELAEYILAHHERWDGTGYPKGLKGEAIPMVARIIALADCYDAMTSERPYRNALSEEEALAEIRNNTGTQFDPEIVRIFLEKVLVA
ncbi:MAG: diguanylate cyclase [Desulfosporosinus sp.]|nr:diguanylate cyclase [Desulfosporosinus sp.]